MRAGVVAVVAAAGLFGIASPAFAASIQLSNVSLDPSTVTPGGEATLRFTVKTSDNMAGNADIDVSSNNGKVTCISGCSVDNADIGAGGTQFQAKVRASGTFTNDESAKITVTVTGVEGTSGEQSSQQTLNIDAPQQQQTVPEISGQVVNVFDNTPIAAAKVFIQDSGSPPQTWEVGTDSQGNFKITSAPGKPISPGVVSVIVEKDGFKQESAATKQAVAGQPLTGFRIPIAPLVSASAAPTPTPELTSPGVSGLPTGAGEFEPPDEGGLSWVLIAVGGLLVLLGIGAIVLLFVKRKGDDDEEGGDRPRGRRGGPPGGPGRGGPRPPQRRGPPPDRTAIMRGPGGPGGPPGDPHRPMRPVSPGPRGADQTMIARSPLADAPTQLHRMEPDAYGHRPGSPGPYPAGGAYPGGQPAPAYPGGQPAPAYPGGAPGYGQPDPYAQPGHTGPPDQYGRPAPPPPPTYGQPYGQEPDPYAPNPDPRAQRSGQDPRRVDWLDD